LPKVAEESALVIRGRGDCQQITGGNGNRRRERGQKGFGSPTPASWIIDSRKGSNPEVRKCKNIVQPIGLLVANKKLTVALCHRQQMEVHC